MEPGATGAHSRVTHVSSRKAALLTRKVTLERVFRAMGGGQLLLGGALLSNCQSPNDFDAPHVQLTRNECVACHAADYISAKNPAHHEDGREVYPKTCVDCHTTSSWHSSRGSHPEGVFPIQTGVHQFGCNDCHDSGRGSNGAGNTNCVGCHVGVHARSRLDPVHRALGLSAYPAGDAAPNFCLECHPSGSR